MSDTMQSLPRPLEGVIVLDLTTALAGPYATQILGGLGARVIKIENPVVPDSARDNTPFLGRDGVHLTRRHADDFSFALLDRNRNKEAITLNLKKPEARDIFFDLARKADIVVENYSPGVADRLGIGYQALAAINPRIVYTAISGFGASANPKQNKAMDSIVQAMSGLMMTSGNAGEEPVRVGVPFGDLSAPLFATIGTLAALMQARATGFGQFVDVSLLGVLSSMVAVEPFEILEQLGQPYRTGHFMTRLAPFGTFRTKDGYIALCAPTNNFAGGVFRAMGKPELESDPRFSTRDARVTHHAALHAMIGDWLAQFTTKQAADILADHGVPSGPVRDPGEAKRAPDLLARGETVKMTHPLYADAAHDVYGSGLPIRMSGSTVGYDRPAATLGANNEDTYCVLLGYSREKLAALKSENII
jgi:crotonobetainyl-CoA:carnitine CoA-transferase CaiB-like acyl-CoA transferase